MKLIARLKRESAKIGLPLDVIRFAADRKYAHWALTQFTATADDDGVLLALQIMTRMRFAAPVPARPIERERFVSA